MKQSENDKLKMEEGFALNFRPRKSVMIQITVPKDALSYLKKVAGSRDMSVEALIKLYVGQGLRQDVAQLFLTESVLEEKNEPF